MTRDEAIRAMNYGCKVTHSYFTDDEYIYMEDHDIISEEGYNFGGVFGEFWWEKSTNENFDEGWSVYFKLKDHFEITAVWDGKRYYHFGIRETTASLYGDDPTDIETVGFKISEDQSEPSNVGKELPDFDYWGWYEFDKDENFSMIYPQRFLLDMCFTHGIRGSEEVHHGKAYRLELVEPEPGIKEN